MSQTLSVDPGVGPSLADARTRSQQIEAAFRDDPTGYRVLTGDRPTGPLHLGHYSGRCSTAFGSKTSAWTSMVLVADYQTITDRDSPASLPGDVEELVADYLAVGIDPTRATIFAHSPGARAQPADAAVPQPGQRGRARAQPDGQGRVRRRRRLAASRR